MYGTVIETKKESDGTIVHNLNTGEILKYQAVRGGICWPLKDRKPYYCIIGEQWTPTHAFTEERKRGKLVMFAEGEQSITKFVKFLTELTDSIKLYRCDELYTSMHDEYRDYIRAFSDYQQERGMTEGRLDYAPYMDNFALGLSVIQEWVIMGMIDLPEGSIVRAQLRAIDASKLVETPEKTYHAINGLRYVLAGYQKYPPFQNRTHEPVQHQPGFAWMA